MRYFSEYNGFINDYHNCIITVEIIYAARLNRIRNELILWQFLTFNLIMDQLGLPVDVPCLFVLQRKQKQVFLGHGSLLGEERLRERGKFINIKLTYY